MKQNYIPDLNFIKERSFEYKDGTFLIKAERILGRLFGDAEYIPQSLEITIDDIPREFINQGPENTSGNITICFLDKSSNNKVIIYL